MYQEITERVLELSKTNFQSKVLRNYRSDVLQQVSYGKFGKYSKQEVQSLLTNDEKEILCLIGNLERIRQEDEKIQYKVGMSIYMDPFTLFFTILNKPNGRENPKSKKIENADRETMFQKLIP